jgi:hypothetical protein
MGQAHGAPCPYPIRGRIGLNINSLINIDYFIIAFPVAPKLLPEHSDQLLDLRGTFSTSSCQPLHVIKPLSVLPYGLGKLQTSPRLLSVNDHQWDLDIPNDPYVFMKVFLSLNRKR